ncbi:MAG: glycosyltransferase [Deltaproteobacteria bacterium]|nr:glycosyltransferase [Deltaproteobacteria bacterium]
MEQPRVSILMPVRNEAPYLLAALDSLYRQTLQEWELVVVDDGSDDATPLILTEASRRDPRVRVIRREGGGLVAALNAGLASCRAPLLARMDGDDICHPRRLELQAAYLDANPDAGLVACAFRHFPRSGLNRGMLAYETWQNGLGGHSLIIRDLFVESPFVHPSVMMRRVVPDMLGGYRDCGWAEDYDLWLRMAAAGVVFARLPQQLFFWRDHPGRATRTMDAYAIKAFRACKSHFLRHGFLKGVSEVVIAGAGPEGRAWQRLLAAEGIRVTCWLDVDPAKLGRCLHGAPVIRTEELAWEHGKMLVAIGLRKGREEFRLTARSLGLREGFDFICVS